METVITQNVATKDQHTAGNIVADTIKTRQRSKGNPEKKKIFTELQKKPEYYIIISCNIMAEYTLACIQLSSKIIQHAREQMRVCMHKRTDITAVRI